MLSTLANFRSQLGGIDFDDSGKNAVMWTVLLSLSAVSARFPEDSGPLSGAPAVLFGISMLSYLIIFQWLFKLQ